MSASDGREDPNAARELPAFSLQDPDPDQAEQGGIPKSSSNSAPERAGGRSPGGSYALALQKACDTALSRVKSNNMIANSNWASPLATAPSAISTMAILFKVADKECAAGLEVGSQDVMDAENNTIRGRLP